MSQIAAVGVGGAFGAVVRYLVSRHVNVLFGGTFPYGTLCVNILGAVVIGFLFSLFEYLPAPRPVRDFLTVGFLGAFTTFSTFSIETVSLMRQGDYPAAILNICLNVVLSLVMVLVGMKLFMLYLSFVKQVRQ